MSSLKRLILEIHQRSLWQALVVYLGASYAVLEAAAYFRDEFGLPDWLPSVALVLLLIGLPVVLVNSLAKEEVYGDEVLARDAEAAAAEDKRLRSLTWRTAGLSFMAAMAIWGVIAAGLVLSGRYERVAANEKRAIAVLPFENLSPDPNDAYFTDGMHEEIISQLGKIASLKVISRTSVMEYGERNENLRTIADELGVTHVLEGTVRRAGDRVRITTQLIAAHEDAHLWAENYDRELRDIFAIQADVARRVVAGLEATLAPEEAERIEQKPTDNLEAYEYYLRGRITSRGLRDDQLHAESMFAKAVELDPLFAAAWAELSRIRLHILWSGGSQRPISMAESALEKAVELAPEAPETHLAQGYYYYHGKRDYENALRHFDIVRELSPSDLRAVEAIGFIKRRQGLWDGAVAALEESLELDPRNFDTTWELAETFIFMQEYEAAERFFDRARALSAESPFPYRGLAMLHLMRDGNVAEARDVLTEALSIVGPARLVWALWQTAWYRPIIRIMFDDLKETLADSAVHEYLSARTESLSPGLLGMLAMRAEEHDVARAHFDSVYAVCKSDVQAGDRLGGYNPNAWRSLGLYSALTGRAQEAIEASEKAAQLLPLSKDAYTGAGVIETLAEVYVIVGDYDRAIQRLDQLLGIPSMLSVPLIRLDPIWDPLRDHPRFQALLEKYE